MMRRRTGILLLYVIISTFIHIFGSSTLSIQLSRLSLTVSKKCLLVDSEGEDDVIS